MIKLIIISVFCLNLVWGFSVYEDPELHPEKTEDGDEIKLEQFNQFIKRFSKDYRPDSNDGKYYARFAVFKRNLKLVEDLNKYELGSAVYGITEFMDLTTTEFQKMNGLKYDAFDRNNFKKLDIEIDNAIPDSFDWKDHGAVTEVKNQGQCGSCWAFSTTGNVEGQWYLKKKTLVSLSEQELLDCDTVDLACNGGLPSQAYKSIEKLGGLETEKVYPYDAHKENCHFDKSKVAVYINDSAVLPSDEDKMKTWLYKNGPISIGINAFAMQFYFGGVSHPWSFLCSPKKLDHGVLITGYGVTNSGESYWNIKNSWGPNWGEEGYYRIYRGDGSCGVDQMPTTAIVN